MTFALTSFTLARDASLSIYLECGGIVPPARGQARTDLPEQSGELRPGRIFGVCARGSLYRTMHRAESARVSFKRLNETHEGNTRHAGW